MTPDVDRRTAVSSSGQEFGNAPSGVVGDSSEHVGEVMLRVEAVELGAFD
jgi:hypothetical protein